MQTRNNQTITKRKMPAPRYNPVPADVLRDFKKVMRRYRTKKAFHEAAAAAGLTIYPPTVKSILTTKECELPTLQRVKKIIKKLAA